MFTAVEISIHVVGLPEKMRHYAPPQGSTVLAVAWPGCFSFDDMASSEIQARRDSCTPSCFDYWRMTTEALLGLMAATRAGPNGSVFSSPRIM